MTIRPLTETDRAVWHDLWQAYLAFYETKLPETTYARTWQRLLDPAQPLHGALAWDGERPLGLVHFIYHPSCWTEIDYCYLQDLYVAEGHRGGGLGRALIEHVYARARADGCDRVHWLTQETNQAGRQLYDRIATRSGFIQYRHLLGDRA
ncbi:GNAT family N-acetyltransferase [Pseudomonas oryzihabitans]|uniref:GNAT family N-acetyltransferase n=1 Tax=Pseudomonas oryzihabitans TaxID=47885 RepID=UPI001925D1B2|nr:GNAT family N-acetyltransferase [Pseudomonas oryzihabitans]